MKKPWSIEGVHEEVVQINKGNLEKNQLNFMIFESRALLDHCVDANSITLNENGKSHVALCGSI